jgi:hypothetical protein
MTRTARIAMLLLPIYVVAMLSLILIKFLRIFS